MIQKKGSETIMEINKNRVGFLAKLEQLRYYTLKSHVENVLEMNEEFYSDDSGYSQQDGYGYSLYLISNVSEWKEVMIQFNLLEQCPEHEVFLTEDDGTITHWIFYLTGSDSGVILLFNDELKNVAMED